jgi:hypothetical protein
MRQRIIPFLACILLASCSPPSQYLPSYVDPDFATVSFRTIAALSDTLDLEWRKAFERTMREEMTDVGAVCHEASAFLPPTRSYTEEQIRDALRGRGIDAWLTINTAKMEITEQIVPEERRTVKEKEPIVERVRYKDRGRWMEKDSVTGQREVITTKTEPAHTVRRIRTQFHVALLDVISGRVAWIGDYWAETDRGYMSSMCGAIAGQLLKDGIVRKK